MRGIGRVHIGCFIFEDLWNWERVRGLDYKRELERMT